MVGLVSILAGEILYESIKFVIMLGLLVAAVFIGGALRKKKDAKKQFVMFMIFSALGLLLNDLIMFLCVDKLNIYYMLAKVIATMIVMVFNFITRKMFLE